MAASLPDGNEAQSNLMMLHGPGGRGRSRTHQTRFARLNGFEGRAPHRERYSSAIQSNTRPGSPTTRRASPTRRVKPLRSKCSSTSMTTLRPMPEASRN